VSGVKQFTPGLNILPPPPTGRAYGTRAVRLALFNHVDAPPFWKFFGPIWKFLDEPHSRGHGSSRTLISRDSPSLTLFGDPQQTEIGGHS
jgi:hypothetical protein